MSQQRKLSRGASINENNIGDIHSILKNLIAIDREDRQTKVKRDIKGFKDQQADLTEWMEKFKKEQRLKEEKKAAVKANAVDSVHAVDSPSTSSATDSPVPDAVPIPQSRPETIKKDSSLDSDLPPSVSSSRNVSLAPRSSEVESGIESGDSSLAESWEAQDEQSSNNNNIGTNNESPLLSVIPETYESTTSLPQFTEEEINADDISLAKGGIGPIGSSRITLAIRKGQTVRLSSGRLRGISDDKKVDIRAEFVRKPSRANDSFTLLVKPSPASAVKARSEKKIVIKPTTSQKTPTPPTTVNTTTTTPAPKSSSSSSKTPPASSPSVVQPRKSDTATAAASAAMKKKTSSAAAEEEGRGKLAVKKKGTNNNVELEGRGGGRSRKEEEQLPSLSTNTPNPPHHPSTASSSTKQSVPSNSSFKSSSTHAKPSPSSKPQKTNIKNDDEPPETDKSTPKPLIGNKRNINKQQRTTTETAEEDKTSFLNQKAPNQGGKEENPALSGRDALREKLNKLKRAGPMKPERGSPPKETVALKPVPLTPLAVFGTADEKKEEEPSLRDEIDEATKDVEEVVNESSADEPTAFGKRLPKPRFRMRLGTPKRREGPSMLHPSVHKEENPRFLSRKQPVPKVVITEQAFVSSLPTVNLRRVEQTAFIQRIRRKETERRERLAAEEELFRRESLKRVARPAGLQSESVRRPDGVGRIPFAVTLKAAAPVIDHGGHQQHSHRYHHRNVVAPVVYHHHPKRIAQPNSWAPRWRKLDVVADGRCSVPRN